MDCKDWGKKKEKFGKGADCKEKVKQKKSAGKEENCKGLEKAQRSFGKEDFYENEVKRRGKSGKAELYEDGVKQQRAEGWRSCGSWRKLRPNISSTRRVAPEGKKPATRERMRAGSARRENDNRRRK